MIYSSRNYLMVNFIIASSSHHYTAHANTQTWQTHTGDMHTSKQQTPTEENVAVTSKGRKIIASFPCLSNQMQLLFAEPRTIQIIM